jgi:hypothetical protein
MDALKAFEFGHLIAFVLPGLVATRALAYYLPSLQEAISKVTSGGEGAVGPLILIIVISAGVGLTISLLRQQWLDLLFGSVLMFFKVKSKTGTGWQARPSWRVNYEIVTQNEKCEKLYGQAVNQVYRYYQFIGNMAIAVTCMTVARFEIQNKDAVGATWLGMSPNQALTTLSVLLFLTAASQFTGWCRVHNQITGSFNGAGMREGDIGSIPKQTLGQQPNPAERTDIKAKPTGGSK